MYYNVGMSWINSFEIQDIRRLASRALRRIDPRTVRVRDTRRRSRLWIAVPLLGAVLVAGAAALATTGSDEETGVDAAAPTEPRPDKSSYAAVANREPAEDGVAPSADDPPEPPSRHPKFHDPFYVFTEGEVAGVTAYPLADPPGIVVNLNGAPEPTSAPESMVGEDSRVRAIRRRVTNKGVRYVLGITIPVKRIDVLHEGSVVIVTPVK